MSVITTNIGANTALRYVNSNSALQTNYLSQLSSGSRVQKASDDASSLAIGTKLKSDSIALQQAAVNAQNGQAVLNTADGGLAQISAILARLKALVAQSLSGAVDDTARGQIDTEYQALLGEVDSISAQTRFNGSNLLDGTSAYSSGVDYLLGTDSTDTITVTLTNVSGSGLGIDSTSVDTATNAGTALTALDSAITALGTARADVGAQSSRFGFRASVIQVSEENAKAAASSFLDADVAQVQTEYTNVSVLTQAGIAALQKANEQQQQILRFLQQ